MLSKRGITQADWVISIGIFMIYLAWFFIVIQPVLAPDTKESLPIDRLKASFMENASWEINITPIIIHSELDSDGEPVVIDFSYGEARNYAVKQDYWVIKDSRLMFLADLSGAPLSYELVHSSYNYTKPELSASIKAGEHATETGGMTANFDESLLDSASYANARRIDDVNMEIDGQLISTARNSFSSEGILSRYRITAGGANNTYYLFRGKPRIYNYIDISELKTISLEYNLDEYEEYYVDSQNQGSIVYNVSDCDSFDSDLIDFRGSGHGLAFIFSRETNIRMCHDNTLTLEISEDVDGTFSYMIMFHEQDIRIRDYSEPYSAVLGVERIFEGLSGAKMLALEDRSYSFLKEQWDVDNEFNITVMNSTKTFLRLGRNPYTRSSIHAESYPVWIIDEYNNQTRAVINIMMW
ncbi:hypothetical protein GF345_02085 [Candidatus Woesearchaeota archaeon]|nr:hypothetical protein [Candidatus Woesearchaeota archaeon]